INHAIKGFLEDLIIKIDNDIVFSVDLYPSDFNVKLNDKIYLNQDLQEIYYKALKIGDKMGIIIPNRFNISEGKYNFTVETPSSGKKVNFERYLSSSTEKTEPPTPQLAQQVAPRRCNYCSKESPDPNQVICEYCGSELKN
ncbi:unnamed protein product, partial [marine sediment metagenome]